MFLVGLLLAVQVLINLYAASVVTAVTTDSARMVARSANAGGAPSPAELARAERDAEAHARALLGGYSSRVTFTWQYDPARRDVVVRVVADNPNFLIPNIAVTQPLTHIDRTIRVRHE